MTTTPHPLFTDREVTYILRTPLLPATLADDYGVDEQTIREIRSSARWNGYGSAPCLADDEDDEPVDTLEADLEASLRALGLEPVGSGA